MPSSTWVSLPSSFSTRKLCSLADVLFARPLSTSLRRLSSPISLVSLSLQTGTFSLPTSSFVHLSPFPLEASRPQANLRRFAHSGLLPNRLLGRRTQTTGSPHHTSQTVQESSDGQGEFDVDENECVRVQEHDPDPFSSLPFRTAWRLRSYGKEWRDHLRYWI